MLVRCKKLFLDSSINLHEDEFLTVGKIYTVLVVYSDEKGTRYQLESDNDEQLIIFEANLFEIVSDYIPSNWRIDCKIRDDNTTFLCLEPRTWGNASLDFYEDITDLQYPFSYWRENPDEMPEVVKLYFQERDLIYKEEKEHALTSKKRL